MGQAMGALQRIESLHEARQHTGVPPDYFVPKMRSPASPSPGTM
jgi:hypothetical protein